MEEPMKKAIIVLITIFSLLGLCACVGSAENPEPSPPPVEQHNKDGHDHSSLFPFLGIWFTPERTSQLVITEAYFYYHDFTNGREVYAEIEAVNLVDNTIDVLMYDIIHGGQRVGFDSPAVTVEFEVTGETLQIVLNNIALAGGDKPARYLHDQVLNP
jgi:hypothetical protein